MSRNFWIGLVASVVIIGIAVGLLLVRESQGSDLTLPDELDGFVAVTSDRASGDGDEEQRKRNEQLVTYNEDELSEALDGAEVVAMTYWDLDDRGGPSSLFAAATDTDLGPLLPDTGFGDPELAGFAVPMVERVDSGDVECLVRRVSPPRAGSDYDEEDIAPSSVVCQRTSGSLSVRVSAGDGATVDQVTGYVDDLYDDLD